MFSRAGDSFRISRREYFSCLVEYLKEKSRELTIEANMDPTQVRPSEQKGTQQKTAGGQAQPQTAVKKTKAYAATSSSAEAARPSQKSVKKSKPFDKQSHGSQGVNRPNKQLHKCVACEDHQEH